MYFDLEFYKYDNQFEQECKSMDYISMAVLLGCAMLKVSY